MKSVLKFVAVFGVGFFALVQNSIGGEDEPKLTLRSGSKEVVFTRSQLLKRSDVEKITIDAPAYPGQRMIFKGVRTTALFDEVLRDLAIDENSVIQTKALDGFAAPISQQRLLNRSKDKSISYVAIEPREDAWPKTVRGKVAGPFYLVWVNPELSHIAIEEWPYQLAAFEVKGTVEAIYPEIFPDKKFGANTAVGRGFEAFKKNCFACHTMNKGGASQLGPDLNVPKNPTEYLQPQALKALIRNPQAIRNWPDSKMSGVEVSLLPDKELNDLVAYLRHMAKRKVSSK